MHRQTKQNKVHYAYHFYTIGMSGISVHLPCGGLNVHPDRQRDLGLDGKRCRPCCDKQNKRAVGQDIGCYGMHYGECRRDIAWDEGQDFKVSVIGRQIIKGYGDGHIMCPSLVFMGQDGSGWVRIDKRTWVRDMDTGSGRIRIIIMYENGIH